MYPTETIEYILRQTRYKAQQIVRRIPALDVDDVQHDLIEDVLRRLPKYDAGRAGVKTFICRVIDNGIADLLERLRAERRGAGVHLESLDDWVHDDTGAWTPRGSTIDDSRLRAHRGVVPRADIARRELEMDVAQAIALLPPEKRVLSALRATRTPTEMAELTGLARSSVYRGLAAIRAGFVTAGLRPCVRGAVGTSGTFLLTRR